MYAFEQTPHSIRPLEQSGLVIVQNPNATNAARAEFLISKAGQSRHYPNPRFVESDADPRVTADRLEAEVEDGDMVYVLGGDGLLKDVAQFLSRADAPDTAVLTSDVGNACNAHRAAINEKFIDPFEAMHYSKGLEPVFLIRTKIERGDNSKSYYVVAVSTMTLGAIATGAAKMKTDKFRQSRWYKNPRTRDYYEQLTAAKMMPLLRPLEVTGPDDQEPHLLMDLTAANAPVIGKSFRFNTQLSEHDFVYTMIKRKSRLPVDALRMQSEKWPLEQTRVSRGEHTVQVQLTDSPRNKEARLQFDGEPEPEFLPPASRITIDQPGHNDPLHKPLWMVFAR